jgi:hypothetical protein
MGLKVEKIIVNKATFQTTLLLLLQKFKFSSIKKATRSIYILVVDKITNKAILARCQFNTFSAYSIKQPNW